MADIFVSYARAERARVAPLVAALEAQGWSVWWDPAITGGQQFDDLLAQELEAARAVVVVWTAASVASRWVRGEARTGADKNVLVPVQFGGPTLPIDARAIHTIDLSNWREDAAGASFGELVRALGVLLGPPPGRKTQASGPAVSICVLPFSNMSDEREQEYFSDGISEDIITDLSKVSALGVISRNSAFTFKGKHVDLPEVARQLKVSHVLEGSVRKSGNRVRITAQLIDGATNNHIWAERYDRDLHDIFALQDEISEAIVGALKLKLLPEEKQAIEDRGTSNVDAYDIYLRARALSHQLSEPGYRRAIELFRAAIALDPSFVPAYAGLVSALTDYSIFPSEERGAVLKEIESVQDRMIAIAPNASVALELQANQHARRRDYLGAERLLEKIPARGSSPPYARVRIDLSVGRSKEALAAYREMARQDPLSLITSSMLQDVLDIVGLPEQAQREYERSKDLPGDHTVPGFFTFTRLLARGEREAAVAELRSTRSEAIAAQVDQLEKVLFDPPAAVALLVEWSKGWADQNPVGTALTAVLIGCFGNKDLALASLRRAYVDFECNVLRFLWMPALAEARKDPRFKQLMRDLGIYDYWRQTGKWGDFARPKGNDDFEIIR